MPPITPPEMFGDRIDTRAELMELFLTLNDQGWRGHATVATVPDDPEPDAGWSLQLSQPSDIPGGLEPRIEARIGDIKIRVGETVTAVLPLTTYESTYGPYVDQGA